MKTIRGFVFFALIASLTVAMQPRTCGAGTAPFTTYSELATYYLEYRAWIGPMLPPSVVYTTDEIEKMVSVGDYSFQDDPLWYFPYSDGPYDLKEDSEFAAAFSSGGFLVVYEDLKTARVNVLTASGKTLASFQAPAFPTASKQTAAAYQYTLVNELKTRAVSLWVQFQNKTAETPELASSSALALDDEGGGYAMMSMGGSNELEIIEFALTNNGMAVTFAWPSSFSNRLDIYSCDGGNYNGLGSWKLADFGYITTGTNKLRWLDSGQLGRGLPTDTEIRFFTAGTGSEVDSDGDGYGDSYELLVLNSVTNDPDSDNDNVSDGPFDPDNTGPIIAGPDAFPLDPNEWLDTDGDGIGDNADTDDDGDGIADAQDPLPLMPYTVAMHKVVSVRTNNVVGDDGAEVFDVSSSGRSLPYASGGHAREGFGRLHGGTFFNNDGTNLYIGIAGLENVYDVGNNGKNSFMLFLDTDGTNGGAASLSAISGTPYGFSTANNLTFNPTSFTPNVGILVGSRYGDGQNFPNFNIKNEDFGQGVFALSSNSVSNLTGFSGTGRPISQWGDRDDSANAGIEIAIPLSSLGMNVGDSFKAAGIFCSTNNGVNRWLSREAYGASVAGSTANSSAFGYNTVTLVGSLVYISKQEATPSNPPPAATDSDVILQGFYWDVPFTPYNGTWYDKLRDQATSNEFSRFSMMWLPPPSKGHSNVSNYNQSVGYDPFDHYDLGTYNSKFSTETRYGSEAELKKLADTLNARGITPIVDLVLNHMAGGYTTEGGTNRYNYQPPNHETFEKPDPAGNNSNNYFNVTVAGEPFSFDWEHGDAGQTADLNQQHPYIRQGLKNWGSWVSAKVGYRGYRWDFTQGMEPWFIPEFMNNSLMKDRFSVMEYWMNNREATVREHITWLALTDYSSASFDFLLHENLKEMCNQNGSFAMYKLSSGGLVHSMPLWACTFAESHDTARAFAADDKWGIQKNKEMAYAFIITAEGIPCIFSHDYFDQPYASRSTTNGWSGMPLKTLIDPLIDARNKYAGGATSYRSTMNTNDLYVAKRNGTASKSGCIIVINDHMTTTLYDTGVNTGWASTNLVDALQTNHIVSTDANGIVQAPGLSSPARGYRIYVRQGDL